MCSMTSSSVTPRRAAVRSNGIQVHDHEVDRRDAVLGERHAVVLARAHCEQPGEDRGMQGLDPPVQDLGEARVVLDRAGVDAVLGQLGGRTAGGDDLDAQLCKRACEIDHPALVEHGEQGPLDPQVPRHRLGLDRARLSVNQPSSSRAPSSTRTHRGCCPSTLTAPLAIRRMARGRSRCSVWWRTLRTLLVVPSVRKRYCLLQNDRSGVDSVIHEVDGHTADFHAVSDLILDRMCAGEGWQQRRMDVDHGLREAPR